MPIWKLTPIELSDGSWAASHYKGEAVIRAPSEPSARSIAAVTLGGAQMVMPGRTIGSQPWLNAMHVRAQRTEKTAWSEDGPFMVLDPPGYEDEYLPT